MEIIKIWFENESIFLETKDGIQKSMPLHWFPRLLNASEEQRMDFEISPLGIHWNKIDEDLSFEGFFKFRKKKTKV